MMCQYCENDESIIDLHDYDGNRHLMVWIEDGFLVAESADGSGMMHDSIAINACPICRCKLKGGLSERFKRWRERRKLLKAAAMANMEAEQAYMLGDYKYGNALFKRAQQLAAEYDKLMKE